MSQDLGAALAVRVKTNINEEDSLYICTDGELCFAKFAYENRPENEKLRNIITQVCDAVTLGLQRLNQRNNPGNING